MVEIRAKPCRDISPGAESAVWRIQTDSTESDRPSCCIPLRQRSSSSPCAAETTEKQQRENGLNHLIQLQN